MKTNSLFPLSLIKHLITSCPNLTKVKVFSTSPKNGKSVKKWHFHRIFGRMSKKRHEFVKFSYPPPPHKENFGGFLGVWAKENSRIGCGSRASFREGKFKKFSKSFFLFVLLLCPEIWFKNIIFSIVQINYRRRNFPLSIFSIYHCPQFQKFLEFPLPKKMVLWICHWSQNSYA